MRLLAGRLHLLLLLLCFNCLAAEDGGSNSSDHDGTKGTRYLDETVRKIPNVYLERSWEPLPTNSSLPTDFPCPNASAIEPCICSVDPIYNKLYLDCTLVASEEQLAAVFQEEFPVKEFDTFSMSSNSAIKMLHNVMNGITFEILSLYPGQFVLDMVSEYFLLDLKDTVKEITIHESKLITETFPFLMLPLLTNLSRLDFIDSDMNWIPPIHGAPSFSFFRVSRSPVERLVNGTISVGTGAMTVDFNYNNISTIEPGSIFFADEQSANSSEQLSISLYGNRLQSLKAGTFQLRNGLFKLSIYSNEMTSIEPGAFVLPKASGDVNYGGLYIDLAPNQLQSLQAGTFPFRNGPVTLLLDSNRISSIEPGTFIPPDTTGDTSVGGLYIDLSYNQLQSLQTGTFPFGNSTVTLLLNYNNISSIEPGTYTLPDTIGDTRDGELYIDLAFNQLQSLQAGTFPLGNGEATFKLNYNNITSIEPGTFVLPDATGSMIVHVYLHYNELTTIDEAVFGNLMPFVASLGLDGNPLTCGCDVFWLIQNTTYMDAVGSSTTCADGTLLHDLIPEDFVDICLA